MSVWLTDLADILRAAGLNVIEETYTQGRYKGRSWKQVGFGGQGLTKFQHLLWHHDASPTGDSPGALDWMKYYANDGAGTDLTPAAACWVCSGCRGAHASGTWHVYAAGLSNHAGRGCNGWGVGASMNSHSLGVETDHGHGESWDSPKKQEQLAGLRRGTAAILAAYNLDPTPALLFHKTWTDGGVDGVPLAKWSYEGGTRGRKTDIDGLDLMAERAIVKTLIAGFADPNVAKAQRISARLDALRAKRRAAKAAGQPTAGFASRIRRLKDKLANLG